MFSSDSICKCILTLNDIKQLNITELFVYELRSKKAK